MRTPICDRFGIEFPIFAFSHCRDVVAAVTNAGGFGVLGALAFEPEQLEIELELDRRARRRQALRRRLRDAREVRGQGRRRGGERSTHLESLIPQAHRDFVEKILAEHGVPPLPDDLEQRAPKAAGLGVDEEGPGPGRGRRSRTRT